MRKRLLLAIVVAIGLASPVLWAQQKKALEVYFIDVEGGQSTLFVSPSGQSLLVDTGWAGTARRRPHCQRRETGRSQPNRLPGADPLSR